MLQWLFLDMDSYFAAVEQQSRPELRGRPVGVTPVVSEGTCCIAASREAKRFGIRTGTGVPEARRLCPEIVFVEARPAFYIEVHHRIKDAIQAVLPIEKVWSIDEVAIRLLGEERRPDRALHFARRIKQRVAEDVGAYLTCTVGIASTKLLAKTASELGKPDGLVALHDDQLPAPLLDLGLRDLPGINHGIAQRLHRHGVTNIQQLWDLSEAQARDIWGSVEGRRYWLGLHGQDVPERRELKRMFGHANVLAPELRTPAGAHAIMTRLLHKAAARLRHHGYFAHHLTVGLAYESGYRWADQIPLPACQDTLTVIEHFERLWLRRPRTAATGPPKKVDVTLSGLTTAEDTPGYLFSGADRRRGLAYTMDRINQRFGGHSLYLGGMHDVADRHMPDKIAFGRIPDEAAAM